KILPQSRSDPPDEKVRNGVQGVDVDLKIGNGIAEWIDKDLDNFLLPEGIVTLRFRRPGLGILTEKKAVERIIFPAEANLRAPYRLSSGYAVNQGEPAAFSPRSAKRIEGRAIPGLGLGTENLRYVHRSCLGGSRRLVC